MKINRAIFDGIFVGAFIAIFGALTLHLTFSAMDLSDAHSNEAFEALSLFFRASPVFIGFIAGLYAGKFTYHFRNRQINEDQGCKKKI